MPAQTRQPIYPARSQTWALYNRDRSAADPDVRVAGWCRITQPVAQRLPIEPWWGVRPANVRFSAAEWGDHASREARWRLRGDHFRRDPFMRQAELCNGAMTSTVWRASCHPLSGDRQVWRFQSGPGAGPAGGTAGRRHRAASSDRTSRTRWTASVCAAAGSASTRSPIRSRSGATASVTGSRSRSARRAPSGPPAPTASRVWSPRPSPSPRPAAAAGTGGQQGPQLSRPAGERRRIGRQLPRLRPGQPRRSGRTGLAWGGSGRQRRGSLLRPGGQHRRGRGRGREQFAHLPGQPQGFGQQPGGVLMGRPAYRSFQVTERPRAQPRRFR
jgi:hypothetical protein